MKVINYIFLCLLSIISLSTNAFEGRTYHTIFMSKPPVGFEHVRVKDKNQQQDFFIMIKPVSQKDYMFFVNELIKSRKSTEADVALGSLSIAPDKNSNDPAILKSGQGIILYATWLGERLSTKKATVRCKLLTIEEWNSGQQNSKKSKSKPMVLSPTNEWMTLNGASVLMDENGEQTITSFDGCFRLSCITIKNK